MAKSAKRFFHYLKSNVAILFFVFIIAGLLFTFRGVISGRQIVLSTNYLANFFSPWSTSKFPGWEQGIPNKPLGTDQLRFFYPGRIFANRELSLGKIPLWNPYIFSGSPNLANFQSAIFYPLNFLYLFLPEIPVWNFQILVLPLIAFVFTYLYLRALKLRQSPAILGAFAFGFSGFILCWMQEALAVAQTAIWLPAILLCIEKYFQNKDLKFIWLLTLVLSLEIISGYLQISVYILGLSAAYAAWKTSSFSLNARFKSLTLLSISLVGAILLCAIQILPSTEALFFSPRLSANIDSVFQTYLLPITHLIKIFIPDIEGNPANYNFFGTGSYNETVLYIGVLPAFFAIYSLFKFRVNSLIRFFIIAFAVSFFLTLNTPITFWILHLPLPLISTFQPSRIAIIGTFCLAVLSSFGLQIWLENKKDKLSNRLFTIVVGTLIVGLGYEVIVLWKNQMMQNGWIGIKNSILPFALLATIPLLSGLKKFPIFTIIMILFFSAAGQFYFLNKYQTSGRIEFLYPPHPVFSFLRQESHHFDRFLAFGAPIREDFATLEKIYSPEGFDPIFSYRYGQLLFASQGGNDGKIKESISRIESTISNLREGEPLSENQRRLRLMSLLGVRNIVFYKSAESTMSASQIVPNDQFRHSFSSGSWTGYNFNQALPRTFLTNSFVVETDSQKIVDRIFDPAADLKTIILESQPPFPSTTIEASGSAKIVNYESSEVKISVQSQENNLLFISDNYFPGWKAFIDDTETKIYRADFAFRAVLVPQGKHTVKFKYAPDSFSVGKKISLISLLVYLVIGLVLYKRKK